MPLLDYRSVRPWAKAIKQAVSTRKMPPWFADPHFGKWANDRSLKQSEIDLLTAWVDRGAPEGDRKDAPAPRTWLTGWNIPKPDLVVQMAKPFPIPATGKVDYHYIVVPLNLAEDKWIQMAEARPAEAARSAVHHIVVFVRDPQSKWLRGEAEPGVPFVPPRTDKNGRPRNDIGGNGNEILTIYTPGNVPDIWQPGTAKRIRAGSDLVLQLHYTPNGKSAVQDQARVGLVYATEPVKERALSVSVSNTAFRIPPRDPRYKVDGRMPIPNEARLISFFPHMHLRGKSWEYRLRLPDGTVETLLRVPDYNFNWQLTYHAAQPIPLPRGARIEASAWFDNSPNNPFNPDPSAEVRWGEQSDEEMMIGFMDILIDVRLDVRGWFQGRRPASE
jgi:hypothetical protein